VSISAKRRGYMPAKEKRASLKEVLIAFKESIWALIFPVILIVGIRFGVFTPSEAGAFAAVYAIFVGAVIYKELTWEAFKRTLKDSAMDIGAIMLIIALSGIIGYGIVYDGVSQKIATLLISITSNPVMLLLIIIVFLIIAGMFVETTVIALLLTPILLPVVTKVGIDPVHFGVIMMTNVTMGIMTPPLGVALYTVSSLMECPPEETVKESIPFFIAYMVVEVLLLLFPQLVLFVPNLIFG
ncbi:MAG TPA: TRAP transporter large permease subunit, partial [Thermoanaerobacterales bacterium]|nr:TRAP transporter large permease subunit [Thermoanaerobacterales bacterium]